MMFIFFLDFELLLINPMKLDYYFFSVRVEVTLETLFEKHPCFTHVVFHRVERDLRDSQGLEGDSWGLEMK